MTNKKAPKTIASSGVYTARYIVGASSVSLRFFKDKKLIAKSKVPKTHLKALQEQLTSIVKPKPSEQPLRDRKTGKITKGVAQDTNKNGTAGKPTTYDPKYCDEILSFFSGSRYERVVIEEEHKETKQGRTDRVKYRYIPNDLPHLEAFARSIGVSYRTLYSWAHDKKEGGEELVYPEFAEAYATAKQLQKEFLITNGLMGNYPPASFIFVAKNITDMKDTKDIKLDNKADEEDATDAEIEEALAD